MSTPELDKTLSDESVHPDDPDPENLPSLYSKDGASVPVFHIRPWEEKYTKSGKKRKEPHFSRVRQNVFLNYLLVWGVKWQAAAVAGVSMGTVERCRKENPEFVSEEQTAEELFKERFEQVATKRAIDGWMAPVFGKDGQIGMERRFDNNLLQFMLKLRVPERYRDKMELQSNTPTGVLLIGIPHGHDLDSFAASVRERQLKLMQEPSIVTLKRNDDDEFEA